MAHPDPSVEQIEQARRRINELANEIAVLSEDQHITAADYYAGFLERLMQAIAAPAGAVWIRTPQGNLTLQYQINMRNVGLERSPQTRQMHDELLRTIITNSQPRIVAPQSSMGSADGQALGAGNPTDFVCLLAPIVYDKEVVGIVEIWQDPNRGREAQNGFLQFVVRMAVLASNFTRNFRLRQISGQQQVWIQLEAFARQIHGSLKPSEVAYQIANEGRRLLEADRVSIALRQPRTTVIAISGADVVEKRSSLVQLMRDLFEAVIEWGERLVYAGKKDDTLPPKVLAALDEYLNESNSKFLVLQPLVDERDVKAKTLARSALLVETFESTVEPEQQLARMEIVARHASSALYNANEYNRIPMRFLWLPLAKIQDGLGGKAKAIITLVLTLIIGLALAMVFVPYQLRIEAKGQLLPTIRHKLYAPFSGQVQIIPEKIKQGAKINSREELLTLYDPDLARQMILLISEMQAADKRKRDLDGASGDSDTRTSLSRFEADSTFRAKQAEVQDLLRKTKGTTADPGHFKALAPELRPQKIGLILDSDIKENLQNKQIKPNEPLLRIGEISEGEISLADWEIELKIPQKHVGQVLKAFLREKKEELDVDILLVSDPTKTFKGRLHRDKIAKQAIASRDDFTETEPVVVAKVRVSGAEIPKKSELPRELILAGTEVHARIRCGRHSMGYSLFYGVWEFLYEKVIFFF